MTARTSTRVVWPRRLVLAGLLVVALVTTATATTIAAPQDGRRAAPAAASHETPGATHGALSPLHAIQGVAAALWDAGHARRAHPAALIASRPAPKVTWVRARQLTRMPEAINHGVALGWSGDPVKSRRAISIRTQKIKVSETVRAVAYKACTSPRALAAANGISWDSAGTTLPAGSELQVPLRFRAASGFAKAVRLRTGPGVIAARVHHTWGRPYVVRLLQDTFRAVHQRWPGRHPFIVHDVSRFGGGKLGGHKSHRAGRDIDIGYPTQEAVRTSWGRPALSVIDYARLWFVIDRMERAGYVAAIYMSPRIQRKLYAYAVSQGANAGRLQTLFQYPCAMGAKRTMIRYAKGHRDHMHIRFASPQDLPELAS